MHGLLHQQSLLNVLTQHRDRPLQDALLSTRVDFQVRILFASDEAQTVGGRRGMVVLT